MFNRCINQLLRKGMFGAQLLSEQGNPGAAGVRQPSVCNAARGAAMQGARSPHLVRQGPTVRVNQLQPKQRRRRADAVNKGDRAALQAQSGQLCVVLQ